MIYLFHARHNKFIGLCFLLFLIKKKEGQEKAGTSVMILLFQGYTKTLNIKDVDHFPTCFNLVSIMTKQEDDLYSLLVNL